MTFNNEHIKQEPCSPSSETISTQHLAGSTMYHHGARAAVPAYTPVPPPYPQYYSSMAGQYNSGSDSQAASPSPKAELKKTILSRRQANGQGELGPLFEDEKRYELTQAEIERQERRREQNRRAAKKCRNKKKSIQSKVSQETRELIDKNKRLAEENTDLERYIYYLNSLIDEHIKSGCCNLQKQIPHYEIQRPASVHVDTEISSAISGAHLTLSSDSIAANGAVSTPVVNSQPTHPGFDQTRNFPVTEPVKNLDSFNLSSLEFTNIVSDLTSDMQQAQALFQTIALDGIQQPHFLHSAQQADLTGLGQCVDPNLVQHNVVLGKQLPHAAPAERLVETSSARSRLVDHCPTTASQLSVSDDCHIEFVNPHMTQRLLYRMEPHQGDYFACDGYNERPVEYQYYSSSQN